MPSAPGLAYCKHHGLAMIPGHDKIRDKWHASLQGSSKMSHIEEYPKRLKFSTALTRKHTGHTIDIRKAPIEPTDNPVHPSGHHQPLE